MQTFAPTPARRPVPNLDDPWRRLLHRWFVEYNPLYPLSAALVLVGSVLLSWGLSKYEGFWASIGISFVGEIYALSLLGGAALLTRIRARRPGVLLALIAMLFQWDLMLHTETCSYWGAAGVCGAAAWALLFAGKLRLFAWALRIRFERRAIAAAVLAAAGLAALPHVLSIAGERGAGALVAMWFFAMGALRRGPGGITSLVELTPWGATVLRRATRAAWLVSGVLVCLHVLYWTKDHRVDLSAVLPALPLLYVRRVRSEVRMGAIVLGTLAFVAMASPGAFSVTALLAGAALCLRALSPTFEAVVTAPPPSAQSSEPPYRSNGSEVARPEQAPSVAPGVVGADERARSFVAAVFAVHLAAWTIGWSFGPWPAHIAELDAALTIAMVFLSWRLQLRSPIAGLVAWYAHLAIQARWISEPRTALQWGASAITLGFVLLAGSLAVSYRLRRPPEASEEPTG